MKHRPTKVALREQAEKILKSEGGTTRKDSRSKDELIQELQVHQIELEMQNDELKKAQANLEEISSKYFDLYNLAPVGYFVFDEEWIILEANLTGSRMLGATKSQIIKKPLNVFIRPEFQDSFHFYRRKLQNSENLETCELKLKNNIFISLESINVLDEQGGRTGKIRSVFTNITERKIVEGVFINELESKVEERTKELQREMERRERAEKKYRNIFENTAEGIYQTTIEGRCLDCNPALAQILGFDSPQEIIDTVTDIGRHLYVNPQERERLLQILITHGKAEGFEFEACRKDGSKCWLSINIHAVRDGAGDIKFLEGTTIDITERKQAEEALRQSEGKYRKIFEGAAEGIYQTTMEGKYLSVNPAFARMFGFSSPQEMIDSVTNIGHQLYVDPQSRDRMIRMLIENGKAEGFEAEVYRKDRSKFWILINIHIVRDESGQILYFEGTNLDITERKRAEEALQKAKDELEDKVKERTAQIKGINEALISEIEERKRTEQKLRLAQKNLRAMATEIGMADERSRQHLAADLHDTVIQTIGAAKLRSELIKDGVPKKLSKDFRELQDFISQSITQARLIMAEMSPPVLNELGFIPAVEWLAEQIEAQHGINIEFNAANGFKPLQHEIQVLLFQTTRELLMNVVKHAHADKARVKMSAKRQKVRIEVIDDGKGFDKRQAFRTDVSSGGFGLFSIRERIRHFGGNLIIQSEAGKGTRVVVTAPHTRGGAIATKIKKRAGSL